MNDDFGMFMFLAAGTVAVFSYLSLTAWIRARKAERTDLERYALYRKLAEMPAEATERVLARLREEDARQEDEKREKANRARRDSLQGGAIILAVGFGLSFYLRAISPDGRVWTVGLMLILIGLVIVGFGWFDRPRGTTR